MERYVEQAMAVAVDSSVRDLLRLPIAAIGPVLEVSFPMPMMARDVPHGLDAVPDGFLRLLESEGTVVATQVQNWTRDVAFVQASDANTIARLVFFTLDKGAIRVVAPS